MHLHLLISHTLNVHSLYISPYLITHIKAFSTTTSPHGLVRLVAIVLGLLGRLDPSANTRVGVCLLVPSIGGVRVDPNPPSLHLAALQDTNIARCVPNFSLGWSSDR